MLMEREGEREMLKEMERDMDIAMERLEALDDCRDDAEFVLVVSGGFFCIGN